VSKLVQNDHNVARPTETFGDAGFECNPDTGFSLGGYEFTIRTTSGRAVTFNIRRGPEIDITLCVVAHKRAEIVKLVDMSGKLSEEDPRLIFVRSYRNDLYTVVRRETVIGLRIPQTKKPVKLIRGKN
jgi:hypothetical protein